MAKKNKRGGKRKNAGRKPTADPKKAVTIYVHKSVIEAYGLDAIKLKCYQAIE